MAGDLDAEGAEPRLLLEHAGLRDARVLEIGAGDGRLTFRYAEAPCFSLGVDTAVRQMARAVAARPPRLRRRLRFLAASALALPFSSGSFDVALFASSL